MATSKYIAQDAFPDSVKDEGIKTLFNKFMDLSNSPNSSHAGDPDEQAFADLFTEDGMYELAHKNAKGKSGRLRATSKAPVGPFTSKR